MPYIPELQKRFKEVLKEIPLTKLTVDKGDIICHKEDGKVGIVIDARYNDADEVTIHWLNSVSSAPRTSFIYCRKAYRIIYERI